MPHQQVCTVGVMSLVSINLSRRIFFNAATVDSDRVLFRLCRKNRDMACEGNEAGASKLPKKPHMFESDTDDREIVARVNDGILLIIGGNHLVLHCFRYTFEKKDKHYYLNYHGKPVTRICVMNEKRCWF